MNADAHIGDRRDRRPAARRGFTLMETLAAVLITSLVVTFALGAYVQIAETAEMATLRLRDDLHATTILDRITSDLESTVLLVAPEGTDPLEHPWYFVAESQGSFGGSDALRFIGRKTRSYQGDQHASDYAQIAYQVETDEDGLQTLYRWMSPGLPERYDLALPPIDDSRSFVLGEGLSGFSLRFSNADGEWVDAWDSTQLAQASLLPISVEIGFDMGVPDREGDGEDDLGPRFQRRVVLPMQPIDLAAMIASARDIVAGGTGDTDEEDEGADGDVLACIQAYCNSQTGSNPLCQQVDSFWDQLDADQRAAAAAGAGCGQ